MENETTPEVKPQQTSVVERLANLATEPDFGAEKYATVDYALKNFTMEMSPERAQNIVKTSGIRASVGEQTAVAVEQALDQLKTLPEVTALSFGNIVNYASGGAIGNDIQEMAFDSLQRKMIEIGNKADAIGGIQSELANLAGGATSFAELALVGLATGGVGSLAQIGVQEMGEGVFNDMQNTQTNTMARWKATHQKHLTSH